MSFSGSHSSEINVSGLSLVSLTCLSIPEASENTHRKQQTETMCVVVTQLDSRCEKLTGSTLRERALSVYISREFFKWPVIPVLIVVGVLVFC